MHWFAQQGYRCRFAWGRQGVKDAVAQGDLLVIVDVLSFSSAVATAAAQGGQILPCADEAEARSAAEMLGAEVAVHRDRVPEQGRFSLSPISYLNMEPGTLVALPSPNGATCSRYAGPDSLAFAGCWLNARAVTEAVTHCLQRIPASPTGEPCVTVVACGERWDPPTEEGVLRFAIEDYLGAGAILSELPFSKSPEAEICAAAFAGSCHDLQRILWECGSGIELREKGYAEDVRHTARWNLYTTAPVLREGRFQPWGQNYIGG